PPRLMSYRSESRAISHARERPTKRPRPWGECPMFTPQNKDALDLPRGADAVLLELAPQRGAGNAETTSRLGVITLADVERALDVIPFQFRESQQGFR